MSCIYHRKAVVSRFDYAEEYGIRYNVQIWLRCDQLGTGWYYCGIGRFCKSCAEVEEYIRSQNVDHIILK